MINTSSNNLVISNIFPQFSIEVVHDKSKTISTSIETTKNVFGQIIESRFDELLISLGKNFNSVRLNLKNTGSKIDNNDIVSLKILRKEY